MKSKVLLVIASFFCIVSVTLSVTQLYRGIIFDIECGDRLKRAGDANTIELAKEELKASLEYMESNGLTNGYTSIVYKTPDEDIGFWYTNIKSAYAELEKIPDHSSSLEKSNMLMKLRETLLDSRSGSQAVTIPEGIYNYPYNRFFLFSQIISTMMSVIFFFWFYLEKDF